MSSAGPATTTIGVDRPVQRVPRRVLAAVVERVGLGVRIALQPHEVAVLAEAVAHVGVEGVGVERRHRRLRGVVGDRLLERVERRPPAAGARRAAGSGRPGRGRRSVGKTIGSNSTSSRNSSGWRAAAITSAAPPIEWPKATIPPSPPGSAASADGGRERVVAVAVPDDRPAVGQRRVAVAAEVDPPRVEARRQRLGDRQVGVAVEAGGVGEQHDRVRRAAGEVVDGDRDAVAGRGVDHREPPGQRGGGRRQRPAPPAPPHHHWNTRSSTTPTPIISANISHAGHRKWTNRKLIETPPQVRQDEDQRR